MAPSLKFVQRRGINNEIKKGLCLVGGKGCASALEFAPRPGVSAYRQIKMGDYGMKMCEMAWLVSRINYTAQQHLARLPGKNGFLIQFRALRVWERAHLVNYSSGMRARAFGAPSQNKISPSRLIHCPQWIYLEWLITRLNMQICWWKNREKRKLRFSLRLKNQQKICII